MYDAFGAGNTACEDELLMPVRQIVIYPCIELWLSRPSVREYRVRSARVRNGPRGPKKRLLCHEPTRKLVRETVARRVCMRDVDIEQPTTVEFASLWRS